jgi:hypothetical protein
MTNFSLDFYFYEHSIYGKKKRIRFPYVASRLEGILQPVHSDVFGVLLVPSLGNYVYHFSFIDDFSRNTWIYFLRN